MRCGKCCTSFGVCITSFDIARIVKASNGKLKPYDFVAITSEPPERERIEPAVFIEGAPYLLILKWKKAQDCIFYEKGIGCIAYLSRPMLCRTYPFRLEGNQLKNMKSRACPEAWAPEGDSQYATDLKTYEKELTEYKKIVDKWNKSKKEKETLTSFIDFALSSLKA